MMSTATPLPPNLSGDPAARSRISTTIASAFRRTPISIALYAEKHRLQPPYPASLSAEKLQTHFGPQVEDGARTGAVCVEAGNYSAVAVWGVPSDSTAAAAPPPATGAAAEESSSSSSDQSSLAAQMAVRPMLREYVEKVDDAKASSLPRVTTATASLPGTSIITTTAGEKVVLEPYYELKFLARDPDAPRAPGAISAVVRPFLERARQEGRPVWLEATEPGAVAVYEHFGFRVVAEMRLGVGEVGPDGWPVEGGEGVALWGMIFE